MVEVFLYLVGVVALLWWLFRFVVKDMGAHMDRVVEVNDSTCGECSKIVRAHPAFCSEQLDFVRPELPACVHFVQGLKRQRYNGEGCSFDRGS